jgi:hypothetical protein
MRIWCDNLRLYGDLIEVIVQPVLVIKENNPSYIKTREKVASHTEICSAGHMQYHKMVFILQIK